MSQADVKQALLKTIAGIQSNPEFSKAVFRAEAEWQEDVRCSVKVRDFAPMTVDEPPELGGQDSAINPVELVLAALGTCQEIMYAAYASVMDIQLDAVKVNVRGYLDLKGLFGLDPDVPPGYQKITFQADLESNASEEQLQKLIETVERHCPVLDILKRAQHVTGEARIGGRLVHELNDAA
jgi:putative redox protein